MNPKRRKDDRKGLLASKPKTDPGAGGEGFRLRRFFRAAGLVPGMIMALSAQTPTQDDEFQLLNRWLIWSDAGSMMDRHLTDQALALLDRREAEVAALRTRDEWLARQEHVRAALRRVIGGFAYDSPLNPRVTGVVRKQGYRIEKIVFESLPRMFVTGCLLIPEALTGRAPTILYTAGSSAITFRGAQYQQHILNLVKHGFIVFAIDPIGQGERLQYHDPANSRPPVNEFNYPTHQGFPTGFPYARLYLRDAMRAIDYLQSRPEVDSRRIGMGGLSWGGWQCTIVSALDDRIAAAASAAGINVGFRRLLHSRGLGSAAKYPAGMMAAGLDKTDFFTLIAPRAFLRVSTTRDYKVIQGAREAYADYRRAFSALGAEDKLEATEDDFGHGYTPKNNEAIYRFYRKHLAHPGPNTFEPVEMMTEDDTRITPTGQVSTSFDGATAFDFQREEAVRLLAAIDRSRRTVESHLAAVRRAAVRLAGVESPAPDAGPVFLGRHRRRGHSVEMHVLQGEAGYVIPTLLFIPNVGGIQRPAIIYVHPNGKAAAAKAGGEVERLLERGYIVAVPDVAGTGETRDTWGNSNSLSYLAAMMNRSLVGIQAGDIMRVRAFLQSQPENLLVGRIGAVGVGSMGPVLLHATALDPAIEGLLLVDAPLSYRSVVLNRHYNLDVSAMVPKALTAYDLPDLLACVAPRRVALVQPRDHLLEPANASLRESELAFPLLIYAQHGPDQKIRVLPAGGDLGPTIDWVLQ